MTRTSLEATARRRWSKILVDSTLLIGFVAEFITREGPDYRLQRNKARIRKLLRSEQSQFNQLGKAI